MTDDLYERYKEALRVGHVAVLRGSLEAAVDAYRTAADIAPSRALPHTSLGGVLLRLGKLDDALVEFAAAVARAPRDEGALLGQAEALGGAGRREEAARALDQVAELQADSGRLPEAADTLRRAIELHDTTQRAERQQDLVRQVRLSAGDHAAEQLLARALRLRDESAPRRTPAVAARTEPVATTPAEPEPAAPSEPAEGLRVSAETGDAIPVTGTPEPEQAAETADESRPALVEAAEAVPQPAVERPAAEAQRASTRELGPATLASRLRGWRGWWSEEAEQKRPDGLEPSTEAAPSSASEGVAPSGPQASEPVEEAAGVPGEASRPEVPEAMPEVAAAAAMAESAPQPQPQTELEPAAELESPAEAEPVGVMAEAGEAGQEAAQSGDELLAAAEAADLDGEVARLRTLLLETARAYGAETRYEAAIDAANRVIRGSPSDLDAHLVLVDLYMARDWNALAVEKLELLGRLAELSGDEEGRQRVCAAAAAAFPRDERLDAICS